MKKILILFFIVGLFGKSNAQNSKSEPKYFKNQTFGINVEIPDWLTIIETGNKSMWGGTFPKVENIENALMITGYKKSEFESFDHFKEVFITGNKFGKPTLFSKSHVWYGYNERDLHKIENGVSCRVFTFFQNKIYHNQFSLIETNHAFIWIQFVATPETYDLNIGIFNNFVESIEFLE